MKYNYILLIVLFFSFDLWSQQNTFELKSYNTNRKIRLHNKTPEVYHVTNKEITSVVVQKKERKTKEYIALEKQIAQIQQEQDSSYPEISTPATKEYNSVPKIIAQIRQYNQSSLSYTLKKQHLRKAQRLIDLSGLSYLAYADQKIHADKLTKFSNLKANSLDLKIHLKRIIWDLEKKEPIMLSDSQSPASKVNSTNFDQELVDLQAQLEATKKYETINNGKKTYTKTSYIMQAKVASPTSLFGTFVQEKENFYVMGYDYKKFNRDELIDGVTMKKNGISTKQTTFDRSKKLIRNTTTNEYYLVSQEFKKMFEYLKPKTAIAQNRTKTVNYSTKPNKQAIGQHVKPIVTYTQKSRLFEDPELVQASNNLSRYKEAIKKSQLLTLKLEGHYKALKDGKMNTKRAKEWKNDIDAAEKLNATIVGMTGKSTKSIKKFNQNMDPKFIDNYYDFSKALSSSKKISGY